MIGQLRDLLHGDPSQNLFDEVFKVVESNPSQEMVDYALGHLDTWGDQTLRSLRMSGFPSLEPSLTLVRFLGVWNNISDAGAAALAASPHLKNLTHLDLYDNNIGEVGAAALAASPHLSNLTHLYLWNNHIGSEGTAALAASPHLKNLTHLDLWGNRIGDEGAAALAASPYLSDGAKKKSEHDADIA